MVQNCSFQYPLINYLVSTKTAQLFVWPRELSTKLLGKLSLLITDFSNVNRVMAIHARVCNRTIILNLKIYEESISILESEIFSFSLKSSGFLGRSKKFGRNLSVSQKFTLQILKQLRYFVKIFWPFQKTWSYENKSFDKSLSNQ